MGKEENKIESYLDDEVKRLGGFTRKFKYISKRGGADRIVFLFGQIMLVEVKTDNGTESKHQRVERMKIRATGARAHVVYGKGEVDKLLRELEIIFRGDLYDDVICT